MRIAGRQQRRADKIHPSCGCGSSSALSIHSAVRCMSLLVAASRLDLCLELRCVERRPSAHIRIADHICLNFK